MRTVSSRVILIDGRRLAELMIDKNVGVKTREIYEVKEVDLSFCTQMLNEVPARCSN